MSKVIDISKHQSKFNFLTAKQNGVQHVIMRCAYGTYKDTKFDNFIKDATEIGMPIGVYHFATWHYLSKSKDYDEAKQNLIIQANKVKEILKPYKIQKYVSLDLELEPGQKLKLGKKELTELCNMYMDILDKAGYNPILYGSISPLQSWLDLPSIKYPLWIAYYNKNGFKTNDFPSGRYGNMMRKYKDRIVMWQYSSKGDGKKFGAGSKYIDLNHFYPEIDKKYIKEPTPVINPEPPVIIPEPPKPPKPPKLKKYRVKLGDTLTKIAHKFFLKLKSLIIANPQIKNPNLIYTGQTINVPTENNQKNPYSYPKRVITKGLRGNDVKWVQWELVKRGYNIGKGIHNEPYGIDGSCGPITTKAIRKFQRYNKDKHGRKLKVDGKVGPLTRWALEQ